MLHFMHPAAFTPPSDSTSASLAAADAFSRVAHPRSFYTAALNPELALIVAAFEFGLQSTPCIKIKLDSNVNRGAEILHALLQAYSAAKRSTADVAWSIDANAAWNVDATSQMLNVLKPLALSQSRCDDAKAQTEPYLYMVEQPFPLYRSSHYARSVQSDVSSKAGTVDSDIFLVSDGTIKPVAQGG